MSGQVIDIYHRYPQRTGEPFGKGHTHQQRPHQSRTARKRHGT